MTAVPNAFTDRVMNQRRGARLVNRSTTEIFLWARISAKIASGQLLSKDYSMRFLLSRTVVALLTVSLIGCTSMQTVAESRSAPIAASQLNSLVAGNDTVIVTDIAGNASRIKIVSILPDAIEGTLDGSTKIVHVQLDQIRKIEGRRFDGTRTTILVVALIGGLYLIIQAAGAASAGSFIG